MFFLLYLYNILFTLSVYSYTKINNKNYKLNEENENFLYKSNSTSFDNEINKEIKNILNTPDKFQLFTKQDIKKLKKRKKCYNNGKYASIFFSSSITEHDIISSKGLKNGSICSSCPDGFLVNYPTYKINRITKDSEPIVDVSCMAGKNLCLCDYEDICYTPNSKNISVMLYPVCVRKQCNVYAILAGYKRNDALISLDNIQYYFSINQINFQTKEYWSFDTDGVYIKVKSIGCNGCNIIKCQKNKKYPRKFHHKG